MCKCDYGQCKGDACDCRCHKGRPTETERLQSQLAALIEYAEATQYWRMEPFDQEDRRAHLEKIRKLGVVIKE